MSLATSGLSFKVLSLLSKERGVYGLRNGDHERYRHHCSNKIHRLRQVTSSTSGKGKVYKKPLPLTKDAVKDVRQLQLLLFSAERALTHSHALKAVAAKPGHPKDSRKDQLSWLRRALKLSTLLHEIVAAFASEDKVNQQTFAEFTIYHLSVRAELAFERQQYAEALTDLASRRKLLSTLADAAKDSYDQALANEFIDAYDPLIRFSAYKLGRAESHDIEGVVKDVDEEMMEEAVPGFASLVDGLRTEVGSAEVESGRKTLEAVVFAGERVEFRSAEIVGVMLRVQEALARLKGKANSGQGRGMKGWDKVLAVLGEAEGVARRLVDDHEASGSSNLRSAEAAKTLATAHQYIIYQLLSHRIRRDLLLVETLQTSTPLPSEVASFKVAGGRAKLAESVKGLGAILKLYDTVLQSLSQLRSLAIVEEKDGVRMGIEGLEAYFHAIRNFDLARLHCIHPSPNYASAVQLLSRSSLLLRQARASLFNPGFETQEEVIRLSDAQVDTISKQIDVLDLAAKRALFAEKMEKPVFFDTAFNYVDLPMDDLLVLAGRKEKAAAEPVAQQVAEVAKAVVGEAKKVVGREKTREATPAFEQDAKMADQPEGKKGWLGGWFGRG